MAYQEAGTPGLERYGLHVDPNNTRLVVEDTVGDRRTILQRFDTGPSLTAQLFDAEGNVINLTGATATFRMRRRFSLVDKIAAGPVTIVDALLGRVRYDWQPGDTDEAGVYDSWVKVTQAGALTSFPSDRSHEVKIDL